MRTLRDFLLAEANLHEGDEDLPKIKKRDWDTWDKLSPGRLSNEVKALLKVKSAKEAKLVVGNENAKAISNPKQARKPTQPTPTRLVKCDESSQRQAPPVSYTHLTLPTNRCV